MKKSIILLSISALIFSCSNKNSTGMEEIQVADSTLSVLGEGAVWDGENNRLLFVDIIGRKLFEFFPEQGKKIVHEMPSMIGTVVVEDNEHVLVALEDGIYRYNTGRRELAFIACPPENDSTQRFNDGKCDPAGRFWVGTMSLVGGSKSSHLFCLDSQGNAGVKLEGITVSNGIVWTADKQYMYYIDTPTRKVMEYRYDNETGEISEPRIAVQVNDSLGAPDGMTIDSEDKLWVCMWGGSSVCCFDRKTGELLDRILVPAKNVTSCAFGGSEMKDLYITTARVATSEEELTNFPDAGALFKIKVGAKGVSASRYKPATE